jgi:predicted ATPase
MFTSLRIENFKVIRDATLPLGRFTLLIGANGSGKSTAMQALGLLATSAHENVGIAPEMINMAVRPKNVLTSETPFFVRMGVTFEHTNGWKGECRLNIQFVRNSIVPSATIESSDSRQILRPVELEVREALGSFRMFQFDASRIATAASMQPRPQLAGDGSNLVLVLDALRDSHPERFEELNRELSRWMPEYDRILFETPGVGSRTFLLRTHTGRHPIPATHLSQGTLLALAFLTVAYLPEPPAIICFEEPEHGVHPRLLREIRDAMYRLAYPENYGEDREPVQVIATTHSPYLLDLYRDHAEEIVIAEKTDQGATFRRLADTPHFDEIFKGEPLGELWYSGIFGGVPATP